MQCAFFSEISNISPFRFLQLSMEAVALFLQLEGQALGAPFAARPVSARFLTTCRVAQLGSLGPLPEVGTTRPSHGILASRVSDRVALIL